MIINSKSRRKLKFKQRFQPAVTVHLMRVSMANVIKVWLDMQDKSSASAINFNRFGPTTLLMDKLCMPSDENFNKLNNSMKFVSENDISVLMEPSETDGRRKKIE